MPGLTAPVLAAAVLLALAAPGKLRQPLPAVNALRAAGMPASTAAVRVLGIGELGLAGVVLLAPSRAALALLAAAYLAFAGFVAVLRRRGSPLSSCGCFGKPDTPATTTHIAVVSMIAGAVALAAMTTGAASVTEVVGAGPWAGLPLLAAVAVTTGLTWAALSVVPAVAAAKVPAADPSRLRVAR